jgi:CRISPR-associated endonuclease/helicase Cas3
VSEGNSDGEILTGLWGKSPRRGQQRGELLTEHLAATAAMVDRLADRTGLPPVADAERFWNEAKTAAWLHDAGKVAGGFQRQVGNPAYRDERKVGGGLGEPWGVRHEVLSLAFVNRFAAALADTTERVAAAVACHHRHLHSRGDSNEAIYQRVGDPEHLAPAQIGDMVWRQVRRCDSDVLTRWLADRLALPPDNSRGRLADEILTVYRTMLDAWRGPGDPDAGLRMALLLGALVAADRIASAKTYFHTTPALPPDPLAGAGIDRPHRHQAVAAHTDDHLVLLAPTGTGKTEATLAWAARQQQLLPGDAPRVWYTLPYLSSINAMAERLGALAHGGVDAVGLVHSKARQALFARALDACGDTRDADRAARAADNATRLHQHTLRVGTPHQLVLAALAGPRHAGELLDAVNSVLIFDEVHAYDPERFGWFLALARLWERLGGRVAAVSATLPLVARRLLAATLHAPVAEVHAERELAASLTRHRLHVHHLRLLDAAAEFIPRWLAENRAVLLVANTVGDAQSLYERHADAARDAAAAAGHDPDTAVMLLHSRFRAADRNRKEQALASTFPTGGQPRRRRGPALVVATQTVEVSLNVSFDAGLFAAAPLDSLLQRAGRANRLGELHETAPVVVAQSDDPVYDSAAVKATLDALVHLDARDVDEQQVGKLLDQVHDSPWGQRWKQMVVAARDRFAESFASFTDPLADRNHLEEEFRRQFEGAEAIVAADQDDFLTAWKTSPLQAADYAIPVPAWTAGLNTDPQLTKNYGYLVLDRPYDPDLGLDLTSKARAPVEPPETIL